MTYADGSLLCAVGMLALVAFLFVGISIWDWLRYRRNEQRGQRPDPAGAPPPIADYCDHCHRPIPQGETVWMDARTGRVLHVRCFEAERDETAVIEIKPDDGGRS